MKTAPAIVPYRYLIVDDDIFTSKAITSLLSRHGALDVQTAENGRIAVQWFDTTATMPDVIICDLNMPELDGVEYMMHLAKKKFSGGIILISGTSPRLLEPVVRLARAHNLGVLGMLTKPIAIVELMDLLAEFGNKKTGTL